MAEEKCIYKCDICGKIVEVLNDAKGMLVCCGKPMSKLVANSKEAAVEKHIPVIERDGYNVIVEVGEKEHPMLPEHYIQWIEVNTKDKVYRKYLSPKDKPRAEFKIDEDIISAREYCNVHGLWQKS